jgi:hypothetical protein
MYISPDTGKDVVAPIPFLQCSSATSWMDGKHSWALSSSKTATFFSFPEREVFY